MVTVAEIRERLSDALVAGGWTRSLFAPGLFATDGQKFGHRHFAIAVGDTQVIAGQKARRAYLAAPFVARLAYELTADTQHDAYNDALLDEDAALKALLRIDCSGLSSLTLDGVTRQTIDGRWFVADITLSARALFALA